MEIKLNAGDKINIPENCKATIENDLIIIEEKKEEFKDGDILHSKHNRRVVIFSNYRRDNKRLFDSYFNSTNDPNTDWFISQFRNATEEEKQKFFDDLKAKGLKWNAETKQMKKIRERAKKGGHYLGIDAFSGKVLDFWEAGDSFDDEMFNSGNYYLPSEREQAEEDAKAIKAIFEKRLKV